MTRKAAPTPATAPEPEATPPEAIPVPLPATGGSFVLVDGQLVLETPPADPATPAVEPGI